MTSVSRRNFVRYVTYSFLSALSGTDALSATRASTFHYTRSGRFTAKSFSPILLGGLLIDDTSGHDLEIKLEEISNQLSFNISLEYGTGLHHGYYFKQALEALEDYPYFFWGASLTASTWSADTLSLPIWRRQAEALFLETVTGIRNLKVNCVNHSRGQDLHINQYLERELKINDFQTFPSMHQSTRIHQLSSVISKSIGAIWHERNIHSNRQAQINYVKTHFGITTRVAEFRSSKAKIDELVLDFG